MKANEKFTKCVSRSANCTLGICGTSKECTETNEVILLHDANMESHILLLPEKPR